MSDVTKIDIIDTLVEYGPGSSEMNTNFRDYSYLEFKNHGRIYNVKCTRYAELKLQSMLGVNNIRFILAGGFTYALSKKQASFIILFGSDAGKYYLVDLFGNTHPEYGDAFSKSIMISKILFYVMPVVALISIPLILFGVGFPMLIGSVFLTFFCRKFYKRYSRFRDLCKSIANDFSGAMSL